MSDSPQRDLDGWASLIPNLVWIQGDQVAKFAGDGPLVTDDHPLPEYFLLRSLFGPKSPPISKGLLQSLTPAPPPATLPAPLGAAVARTGMRRQ